MDNEQQYKDEIYNLELQIMNLQNSYVQAEKKAWLAEKKSAQDAQIARKAEARTVEMQQRMHNFETQVEAVKKLYGDQAWEDAGQHVRLLTQVMRLNERIEYLEREREKDAQILVLIHNKTGARLGYEDYDDDDSDDDNDSDEE